MSRMKATDKQISYIESLMKHTLQWDQRDAVYLRELGTADLERVGVRDAAYFIDCLNHRMNAMRRKSRAVIIARLCELGYTNAQGFPDYDRINEFIKNIGSNNPRKVMLTYLYPGELNKVVTQVKAMHAKAMRRS